jgi:type II secretory pathway pseudopilin PulG
VTVVDCETGSPQALKTKGQSCIGDSPSVDREDGFMLLAAVLLSALLLISLSVAAPVIARELRRDKEVESQHRAQRYVRAMRLYSRKFGQYPSSVKSLESSNTIRFLRHQYVDTLTGKAGYKLIHHGEQKTKIHVFFGKELDCLAAGLSSAAAFSPGGMGSPVGAGMNGALCAGSTNVTSTSALNSGFGGATTIGVVGVQAHRPMESEA